jgi:hypothetical protein
VAVTTDNCTSTENNRRHLEQERPDIYTYGCNSHLLNLICQHFTPKGYQEQVQKVPNYIRNRHFPSSRLPSLGGKHPVLAGATRCNKKIDSFLSFTENHIFNLKILREMTSNNDWKLKSKTERDMKILVILYN